MGTRAADEGVTYLAVSRLSFMLDIACSTPTDRVDHSAALHFARQSSGKRAPPSSWYVPRWERIGEPVLRRASR